MEVVPINKDPFVQGDLPGPITINFGDFDDIPGLEVISDGISTTTLGSLAISCQGRYLFWAFTADPMNMTAFGQDLFVNGLHHIHKRRDAGHVRFKTPSRRRLAFRARSFKKTLTEKPEFAPKRRQSLLSLFAPPTRNMLETLEDMELVIWVEQHLPFIAAGLDTDMTPGEKDSFSIDREAHGLGTPNNQLISLKMWCQLAPGRDDDGRAARILLKRYVDESLHPTTGTWWNWWMTWGERVTFCDSAGFVFLVPPQ